MPCLCSLDLSKLAGLSLPAINVALPKVALDLQAILNLPGLMPGPPASFALMLNAGLPSVSLSAAAKLSAAASLMAGLKGAGLGQANLSANLSMVVQSVNLNLGALLPLINISGPSLSDLAKLAALMLGLQGQLKIDLRLPDAAVRIQAALNAMAGPGGPAFLASLGLGMPAVSANLSASASASLAASLNFGMKALFNLALALGVNLNVPNPLAALAAALGPLLALNIPPLTIPPLQLGQLLSITAALGSIKMAMGINLALPNALGLLLSLLPKLNLALLANLSIPNLSATLSAQASANLIASVGPLDGVLAGLNLSMMANANLALGLAVSLGQLGIKLALSPCLVCKIM